MNNNSVFRTYGVAAVARTIAAPGSAVRRVDLPGLRPSHLTARRRQDEGFEDWPVLQPDDLEDWDSEEEAPEEAAHLWRGMGKLGCTLSVAMPRRQYFAQLVERLPQSGFEFADLDLIRQTITITRHAQQLDRRCRICVRLFGCGDQTGVAFSVERPVLARFHAEKHLYVHILKDVEAILLSAARQNPEVKRELALRFLAELDNEDGQECAA